MQPLQGILQLDEPVGPDQSEDAADDQKDGDKKFGHETHGLSLLDNVAAQKETAVGHGGHEADHGDQHCCLKVNRRPAPDSVKHQQGDDIDHHRIKRKDAIRGMGAKHDPPEIKQQGDPVTAGRKEQSKFDHWKISFRRRSYRDLISSRTASGSSVSRQCTRIHPPSAARVAETVPGVMVIVPASTVMASADWSSSGTTIQ